MIIDENKTLYHGSYMIVDTPDLSVCKKGKDFGQGFYLTTDIEQARRFVKSAIGKAQKNGIDNVDLSKGYVSVYKIKDIIGLNYYEFESADIDWLHCVAAHRRSGLFTEQLSKWERYDLIAGKIANDATNQVLTTYINGLYGTVGKEAIDTYVIGLLMPDNLTDQICVRTQNAIDKLCYIDYEEVIVKNERE